MKNLIFSIDVEPDIHSGKYDGITKGLIEFEKIINNHPLKPILFVTADCLKKYPSLFKRLSKKGWDISFHGYTHKRFDDLSFDDKEYEITNGLKLWKNLLGFKPKGFRAPQHSIDKDTLFLLHKYKFEYDSSYTPFNLLQLVFFPKRISSWLKLFFSRPYRYKIYKNLTELPIPSLILPPVSLIVRVLPFFLIKIYFSLLIWIFKEPIFYAHSWDFIEIKNSKIDRLFSHKRFILKLEKLIKWIS